MYVLTSLLERPSDIYLCTVISLSHTPVFVWVFAYAFVYFYFFRTFSSFSALVARPVNVVGPYFLLVVILVINETYWLWVMALGYFYNVTELCSATRHANLFSLVFLNWIFREFVEEDPFKPLEKWGWNNHCKPNEILKDIALDEWLATFMLSCLCLNFFFNIIMLFYSIGLLLSILRCLISVLCRVKAASRSEACYFSASLTSCWRAHCWWWATDLQWWIWYYKFMDGYHLHVILILYFDVFWMGKYGNFTFRHVLEEYSADVIQQSQ